MNIACALAGAGCLAALLAVNPHGISGLGVVVVVLVVSVPLAAIDFNSHRLPDVLVLPTLALVVVWVIVATAVSGDPAGDILAPLAGCIAAMSGPLLLAHLINPAGLGFGDVKFSVLWAIAVGWACALDDLIALEAVLAGAAATAAASAVHTAGVVVLAATRRSRNSPSKVPHANRVAVTPDTSDTSDTPENSAHPQAPQEEQGKHRGAQPFGPAIAIGGWLMALSPASFISAMGTYA